MHSGFAAAADGDGRNGSSPAPLPLWPARVLVVESAEGTTAAHAREFRSVGVSVVVRHDFSSALIELGHSEVDAVVASTDLAGMSVGDFTDVVVSLTRAPVLIALAGSEHQELAVSALDRGARAIIPMPIEPARVASELRNLESKRIEAELHPVELSSGELSLSTLSHRVTVRGREVHLSPKEFAVLEYLLRASPRVVHLSELVQRFEQGDASRVGRLRVLIARIRVRIDEIAPGAAAVLHTVRGLGYRLGD